MGISKIIIICLFVTSVFSQDENIVNNERKKQMDDLKILEKEYDFYKNLVPIGDGFFQGENLVYNCEKSYFVCAHAVNAESCEESRKNDIFMRRNIHSCVSVKKFQSMKKCREFVTNELYLSSPNLSFCFNY